MSRTGTYSAEMIEALNSECFCISLDGDALRPALESELGQPGLSDSWATISMPPKANPD